MRILFFGRLRDALGEGRELAVVGGETIAQLRHRLADIHPETADELLSPRNRICVGDSIVGDDFVVSGQDSVEFFPPLSGG